MRNIGQGLLGSEGSDDPALQQLMEAMRALKEANEDYRREQERIQEEVKAEQEWLRAEVWAEHDLLQDRLMAEIEVSRIVMEKHVQTNKELRKTNEELRKNLHWRGRYSIRERFPNLQSRVLECMALN